MNFLFSRLAWGSKALGDAKRFYRALILPHIFIFLLLIVVDSVFSPGFYPLLLRILAIFYVLGFYQMFQLGLYSFTARVLSIYFVGLVFLLASFSFLLGLDPFSALFVPIGLLFVSLLMVPTPFEVAFLVSSIVGAILGLYWCMYWIGLYGPGLDPVGPLFAALGFMLLCMGSFYRTFAVAATERELVRPARSGRIGSSATEPESVVADREQLFEYISRFVGGEIAAEFAWRLLMLSVVTAAFVFGIAYIFNIKDATFAFTWLIVCAIQLFLCKCLLEQQQVRNLYAYALLMAMNVLIWWALLGVFGVGTHPVGDLLLLFLILALSALPWPGRYFSLLALFFFMLATIRSFSSEHPVILALATLLFGFLGLRISSASYLTMATRVAVVCMGRVVEASSLAITSMRMLAWQIGMMGDSRRSLLVFGSNQAEIVEGGGSLPSSVDPIFIRGLVQQADLSERDDGILLLKDLGKQFYNPLVDWFLSVPHGLYYLRFVAIIDNREQRLLLFVPLTLAARFAGEQRVLRSFVGVATLLRISLAAQRSRFFSSDVLLASERSITEREEELTQIIHHVNNVAQDVALHCEQLRDCMEALKSGEDAEGARAAAKMQIEQLEGALSILSKGVTDIKLLKELSFLRDFKRVERVEVSSIVPELDEFGRHYAQRKGERFEVQNKLSGNEAVRVVSREYLETVVRLLMRLASKRLSKDDRLLLRVYSEQDMVVFEVADSGPAVDDETKSRILEGKERVSGAEMREDYVGAITNLAIMSEGKFMFLVGENGLNNRMALSLPIERAPAFVPTFPGQWVLLVDDNIQVTTFYARIATALQLKYFTAGSVAEARKIVQEQGRPRLVITDLQLGDGSGLDLIASLRETFGRELPVIVVSGDTGDHVQQQVQSAGVTKHLTKPVGRRKLFDELRGLLAI